MTIEEYRKNLNELLAKGLYVDEADAVMEGKCTLEEALKNHKALPVNEGIGSEDVEMETYEDAEKIMQVVREITAKESE